MEEKERFELFGEHCIKDNNPDARPQLLDAYVACVILNDQDKKIKELKEENQQLKQNVNTWKQIFEASEKRYQILQEYFIKVSNLKNDKIKQLTQSQEQLAISELKLVLENFKNRPTYFDVARQELCLSNQDKQFIDFINSKIKELGGERNE